MITNNRKKIYKNQNNSNVQQKYKKQNMSCHLTLSAPLSKISKSTTILKNIRTNTQYSYNCEQWGATIYIHTTHIKYTLHKMTHCGNRYGEKMFAVSCSGVATQSNWTTKNQPKKKKSNKTHWKTLWLNILKQQISCLYSYCVIHSKNLTFPYAICCCSACAS